MALLRRISPGSFAAALAALVGCGGATASPGEPTSITGTLGGQPFVPADSIGQTYVTTTMSGQSIASAGVVLGTIPGLCAVAERHGSPPSVRTLAFQVTQDATTIAPGTYGTGQGLSASYEANDATCAVVGLEQATGGTVTFTTSTATVLEGTFDLTFEGGDHLSGPFSAPVCADLLFQVAWQGTCGS
jgi:hypothetical protein